MCGQNMEDKKTEFEGLALQHMEPLYGTALRMTRDDTEAQDLVQDVYLRAYRFFNQFEKGTNFKAWLFRILKNVYINKYRKQARLPKMVDISDIGMFTDLANVKTPENEIFDKLLDDDITNAMNSLPEEFRLVIILSDIQGFSYKETAEILSCPIGTVMSRLHRGRRLLRISLQRYARERGYIRN